MNAPIEEVLFGDTRKLCKREVEVLDLMAQGKTNKEIAAALGICHTTLRTYKSKIYWKLDTSSVVLAVLRAIELGIVKRPTSVATSEAR